MKFYFVLAISLASKFPSNYIQSPFPTTSSFLHLAKLCHPMILLFLFSLKTKTAHFSNPNSILISLVIIIIIYYHYYYYYYYYYLFYHYYQSLQFVSLLVFLLLLLVLFKFLSYFNLYNVPYFFWFVLGLKERIVYSRDQLIEIRHTMPESINTQPNINKYLEEEVVCMLFGDNR